MKINVYIERIVLDGLPVDRNSAPLIQEAVQAELSRLFADSGASQSLLSGGSAPSLLTDPIHIMSQTPREAIGHRVANAVHGVLQS